MATKEKIHTEMTPKLVEREYVYKTIKLLVRIDFKAGEISLLDQETNQGKKWLFAKRGVEYMQGWHDILDGMKYAIDQATAEMEAYQKMMRERNEF